MNVAQELGDDGLYDYDILDYWETGLIQHLVSRPPGPNSMAGYDVIMKTQIRLLTLLHIMSCRLPTELTGTSTGVD